jgi:lipoprotein-releasing system permease protein
VVLYGLKPEEEKRVSRIAEFIDQTTLSALSDGTPQLILGLNIAARLQVEEGEQVMMVVPNTDTQAAPRLAYFHLLKVLRTETELDNALAITHINQAAQLTGTPEAVTGMRLMVTDLFAARDIVWESIAELGFGYYGSSWINTHGNLYQAIQMSKKLVTLLMSLIVAIAAFNVVSTLVMVVVEKQGDIAILRTYGASTSCIMAIFIVQGSVIGLLGTLLGLGFGLSLTLVVEPLLRFFEAVFGMQFLKSDVYPLTYLPTEIRLDDLVQVGITALIMSFFATIYPAWRASRSRPADVLRYE